MPAFIFTGPMYVETPQQNAAGINIGFNAMSNNDANMKFNTAQGGNFGFMSVNITGGSLMLDNLEYIDGVINANDVKTSSSAQF